MTSEKTPDDPQGTGAEERAVVALPIDTAPRDGSLLRLLVRFDDHQMEDDADPQWTIGMNNLGNTEVDEWQFCGWDWCQDRFTQGVGTPIGWLPLFSNFAPEEPVPCPCGVTTVRACSEAPTRLPGCVVTEENGCG